MLVGVLALARFALAAAAWDTGNGFALMGAARDLMIAVFGEALLVLALARRRARPPHSTDLAAMSAGPPAGSIWCGPAHWCGALAFALVVLVETGRQPIDNPDTHLELTMIHEGPLLEYAGRDLAFLQWAAAARHWVVLVLGAELFLPARARRSRASSAVLAVGVAVLCAALAVVETAQAKMRILRVPALLGVGCAIALAGASPVVGGVGHVSGGLVSRDPRARDRRSIVVRRRSVAIALRRRPVARARDRRARRSRGGRSSDYLVAALVLLTQGGRRCRCCSTWLVRRTPRAAARRAGERAACAPGGRGRGRALRRRAHATARLG